MRTPLLKKYPLGELLQRVECLLGGIAVGGQVVSSGARFVEFSVEFEKVPGAVRFVALEATSKGESKCLIRLVEEHCLG